MCICACILSLTTSRPSSSRWRPSAQVPIPSGPSFAYYYTAPLSWEAHRWTG